MAESKSTKKYGSSSIKIGSHTIGLLCACAVGYVIGTMSGGILPARTMPILRTTAKANEDPVLKNINHSNIITSGNRNDEKITSKESLPIEHKCDTTHAVSEETMRQRLSAAFRNMKDRGELPQFLNDLGLKGEGVEVGVRNGDFSKHILDYWHGSKMHMVDPWEHQDEAIYKDISNRDQGHQDMIYNNLVAYMKQKHPNRHQIHRGYSVQKAKLFPDHSLDFVYLDARHDYDGVKEDLEAWWDKLRVGGVMAGHDFVPDGLIPAGLFGVQKAVWEFTMRKNRILQSISTKDKDGGRSEPQRVDGGWTTWYFIK